MRVFLLTLSILIFGANVLAQERSITGKVFAGTEDSVLAGATITVKGTRKSAMANDQGFFQLKVTGPNAILVVEYLGYTKQEVPVMTKSSVNIFLVTNPSVLNEVVVTGYGQQSRRTLTSAITSVSAKEIANVPQASANSMLQGRAAGVQVNNNSGTPGGGVFVRIRGSQSITAGNEPYMF